MIIPRSIGQIGKIRTEKKLRARAIIGQGQPCLVPISGIAWTATRLIVCTLCSGSAPVMTCTASASRIIRIPPRNTDRYGTAVRRMPVEALKDQPSISQSSSTASSLESLSTPVGFRRSACCGARGGGGGGIAGPEN